MYHQGTQFASRHRTEQKSPVLISLQDIRPTAGLPPESSSGESTPPSDTSGLHNPNRSPERDRISLHERCERGSDGTGDRSNNVWRLALEGSADRADLKCTLNGPFQALPDR